MQVALLLVALALPSAGAAAPAEIGILDAYLGEHDAGGSWDHCQRHGGPEIFSEQPAPPLPPPAAHTNELLRHHTMWHKERLSLLDGQGVSTDDADRYGDDFYSYHRAMVAEYDAWRAAHGHAAVAPWDPTTPIPPEFAPDPGAGCIPRRSEDPRIDAPSWATLAGGDETDPLFAEYRALCEFPDLNRLGKAIDFDGSRGYHGQVHDAVNGDMAYPPGAPRDPIFWAWHKFLDETVFATWERECPASDAAGAAEGATLSTPRSVPAAPLGLALALAGAAAILRRRSA